MQRHSSAGGLDGLIDAIETDLSDYYGFALLSSARDHLVGRAELESMFPEAARAPEMERGSVWVVNQPRDTELFIGVHFSEAIREVLVEHNPLDHLDRANIDAFFVLVEELSHFHLILNRAAKSRSVTQLELEWQGEIDKLLMAALHLKRQSGRDHHLPLARLLFEEAAFASFERERYEEASRYAAQFWYRVFREPAYAPTAALTPPSSALKRLLRLAYHASWSSKIAMMNESMPASLRAAS